MNLTNESYIKIQIKLMEEVYQLLQDPKRWITGNWAEDREGCSVAPKSKNAEKFCVLGAIRHFAEENYLAAFCADLENFSLFRYSTGPSAINDYQGHQAVLNLCKGYLEHLLNQLSLKNKLDKNETNY